MATEEGIEEIAQATAENVALAATGRATEALGAELVVATASLGVGQHLVGPGQLLELLLGARIVGIGVGVQFPGAPTVGLLDVVVARLAAHAQQIVEVGHRSRKVRSRRGGGPSGR